MTPSFEFFDVSTSTRAYYSAAEQERAGYLAELTHGAGFRPEYDFGVAAGAEGRMQHITPVGMG